MNRAQSEVTGEILLVGIIVLSVSTLGIAYVASVGVDQPTLAELSETSGETEYIEISHAGGQTLSNDSIRIVIQNETTTVTLALTDGEVVDQPADDRFGPGHVWRWDDWGPSTLTGREVDLRVITDDRILLETTKTRPQ